MFSVCLNERNILWYYSTYIIVPYPWDKKSTWESSAPAMLFNLGHESKLIASYYSTS